MTTHSTMRKTTIEGEFWVDPGAGWGGGGVCVLSLEPDSVPGRDFSMWELFEMLSPRELIRDSTSKFLLRGTVTQATSALTQVPIPDSQEESRCSA